MAMEVDVVSTTISSYVASAVVVATTGVGSRWHTLSWVLA